MNPRPTIGLVVYPKGSRWIVANSRNPPHPIRHYLVMGNALEYALELAAQGVAMGYDVTIHASPVAFANT